MALRALARAALALIAAVLSLADDARDADDIWGTVPSPDTSCLVVDGVVEHNADLPVVPASTIKLFVAAMAPSDPRVEPMLVDSDNDAATALVAEHGLPSWPGVVAHDATGHDRRNRVTCRALVDVLREHPDLPLAIAGRTGTLRDRMRDVAGLVRGKTGSLRGVEALAGRTEEGRVFAIVLNDLPSPDAGRRVVDALGATLVVE